MRQAHVGEPGGQIRRTLPAETVLWRQHQLGLVSFFAQRLDERARHHQMAAFDEQRRRGDDGDRISCEKGQIGPQRFAPARRLFVAREPSQSST